jgi:hypothetical protein
MLVFFVTRQQVNSGHKGRQLSKDGGHTLCDIRVVATSRLLEARALQQPHRLFLHFDSVAVFALDARRIGLCQQGQLVQNLGVHITYYYSKKTFQYHFFLINFGVVFTSNEQTKASGAELG